MGTAPSAAHQSKRKCCPGTLRMVVTMSSKAVTYWAGVVFCVPQEK